MMNIGMVQVCISSLESSEIFEDVLKKSNICKVLSLNDINYELDNNKNEISIIVWNHDPSSPPF